MGIYEGARDFVSIIKSTREFDELVQAKNYIERNSSLKSEVLKFSRRLADIYSSNKSAKVIESKVTELYSQFGSLSKITEVDRFLKASKTFNDMMIKVYRSMNDSIEAELKLR